MLNYCVIVIQMLSYQAYLQDCHDIGLVSSFQSLILWTYHQTIIESSQFNIIKLMHPILCIQYYQQKSVQSYSQIFHKEHNSKHIRDIVLDQVGYTQDAFFYNIGGSLRANCSLNSLSSHIIKTKIIWNNQFSIKA